MERVEREALVRIRTMMDAVLAGQELPGTTAPEPGAETALLPVPYISQLGQGADKYSNDCGAAAGAMLIQAYSGKSISPNKFFEETGQSSDRYLSASQIMRVLRKYDIPCTWQVNLGLNDLFTHLRKNRPLIVLINYKTLQDVIKTQSSFSGPHFSPVVGVNIRGVYIHDPLWSNKKGKALAIPIDTFVESWRSTPHNSGVSFGAIVPSIRIGDSLLSAYKVRVTVHVLNVRRGPGSNHPINGNGLLHRETVSILEVSGVWGRIGPQHWIHLDYTERI